MKILLYDCESLPNVSLTWGTYDQNVIKVLERRMVCSIAWQWYPSHKKEVLALCDMPGYDPKIKSNRALIEAFLAVLTTADVAVGHNIDEFDDKMVNTDIFIQKLTPPAPHKTVDTLRVCRTKFRLNSNKLGDVCEELGIGKKVPHPGISMWEGCRAGDAKSWETMKKYNLGDVDPLLRGLYEHVRPWMTRHPNVLVDSLTPSIPACPTCGHNGLSSDGWRYTQTQAYIRMICQAPKCRARCRKMKVGKGWAYRPLG